MPLNLIDTYKDLKLVLIFYFIHLKTSSLKINEADIIKSSKSKAANLKLIKFDP